MMFTTWEVECLRNTLWIFTSFIFSVALGGEICDFFSLFEFILHVVNMCLGYKILDDFYKYAEGESQECKAGAHTDFVCAHWLISCQGIV